jgi:hypothetical protein
MMSKREAPALKLTVEDGRLVPASAWDQERLLSYRNRSTVNAYVTQDKPRWMERKYWAILDRVITTCGVKQRTAEDLHDHIKLKLGFVNAKFDDSGKLKVTLKSTKLMEDPEYEGFFKEAMGYLFDVTGVDPLTLKKEAADVGEDEQETPAAQVEGDGSGAVVAPSDPAADPSDPVGGPAPVDETEAREEPVASSAGDITTLKRECISKFLAAATDPTIPSAKDRQETVIFAKEAWKQSLPTDLDFVKACTDTANKVVKGELSAPVARHYLEGLL